MRENLLYERFKSLLEHRQVVRQDTAAEALGLTEGQLFEQLMIWYRKEDTNFRIIDDLIISNNLLDEHDITYKGKTIHCDEEEDVVTFGTTESSLVSSFKNNIRDLIDKSEGIERNSFVVDKCQHYFDAAMSEIEHAQSHVVEPKKPITIPKITRKDQIYWTCESCGLSNPYFLSKCKECSHQRPCFLYENHEPVSISTNATTPKRPISHVITAKWQTVDIIAGKMGIIDEKEVKQLKNKLKYLAKVNYVIPDSTGTMFKLNNFEM